MKLYVCSECPGRGQWPVQISSVQLRSLYVALKGRPHYARIRVYPCNSGNGPSLRCKRSCNIWFLATQFSSVEDWMRWDMAIWTLPDVRICSLHEILT